MEKELDIGPGSGPLGLTHATENDPEFGLVTFETGRPVTFTTIRNTEKSPFMGALYGQNIEPAGRYMLHDTDMDKPGLPARWRRSIESFRNPLVVALTLDTEVYGPMGWKARLSREMNGKTGRALSAALRRNGYDGIVTVERRRGEFVTAEIVALE